MLGPWTLLLHSSSKSSYLFRLYWEAQCLIVKGIHIVKTSSIQFILVIKSNQCLSVVFITLIWNSFNLIMCWIKLSVYLFIPLSMKWISVMFLWTIYRCFRFCTSFSSSAGSAGYYTDRHVKISELIYYWIS